MKADILAADRGEVIAQMEPMLLGSRNREELTDIALRLSQLSAAFRASLPTGIAIPLADLVRSMNCYYSNLIEGHNTHPVDIEKALLQIYSNDTRTRDLQLEATAHIAVQKWIDQGGLQGRALTESGICEVHRRFCELMPDDLLWVNDPATDERIHVDPGELRKRHVKVGLLTAIGPAAVPRFLKRFESVYSRLGKMETILSSAAMHHRLLWMHPFLDGNGRVARLISHAVLFETLETGALWSIARGLARNATQYKNHLSACDMTRRNDLDGRGNLSEESLVAFTRFFLNLCIDQVQFMQGLIQPDRLRARILLWAEEEVRLGALPGSAGKILEAVLYRGELPRGEIAALLGTGERQARRLVAALTERGVLGSETPRSPLHLLFPATLAGRWMPGLFPDSV